MLIIGIAGGTGSGKTTVVKKIIESLPPGEVVLLPQDSYYKDNSHVPVEKRQYINFDHPDAFDWPLLSEQVTLLKEGKCIEQPTYSYLTCCRCPRPFISSLVMLSSSKGSCFMRPSITRLDGLESICRYRFGRTSYPCDPTGYDRERTHGGSGNGTLYPGTKAMHLQFIEPSKRYADLIIPEGGSNQIAINILKMFIENNLGLPHTENQ